MKKHLNHVKFKSSSRIILMSFLSIISLCSTALATFAWLDMSHNAVDEDLIFTSAGSTLKVNIFGHAPYDDSNDAPVCNVLTTTGEHPYFEGDDHHEYDESKGYIHVEYSLNNDTFGLNRLPDSDLTISTENMPRYYLELRYIQHDTGGFVKANIENFQFDNSANTNTVINISHDVGLSYRYVTNTNNDYHKYLDGFTAATYHESDFNAAKKLYDEDWIDIPEYSSYVPIYTKKDWQDSGYNQLSSNYFEQQLYVPKYHETYEKKDEQGNIVYVEDYYSKSTIIEVGVNPEQYLSKIKEYIVDNNYNYQFKVGFSFDISLSYSHAIFK